MTRHGQPTASSDSRDRRLPWQGLPGCRPAASPGRDGETRRRASIHQKQRDLLKGDCHHEHHPGNLNRPADRRGDGPPRGIRPGRRRATALRRGRQRPARRSAARLSGVLVRLAGAVRAAGQGGLSRRSTRPAWLRPVVEAGRVQRVHRRQAGRRHPRSHPRARRRFRIRGRPRLRRICRVDPGDEQPRGRQSPGHLERRPPAQAERRADAPAPAREELVLLLLPAPGPAGKPRPPRQLEVPHGLPARRPAAVHRTGAGPLPRGVVTAGGCEGHDRLLPRRGAAGVEAEGPPDLGTDHGHLG